MAKIVVIDDDPEILILISAILKRDGHSVVLLDNGKKGIDYLRNKSCDILITDIFMPEMEGLETVKHALAIYPTMPVIGMSGGGSRGEMQFLGFAHRFGAAAVLEKPFLPRDLLDLVTELLPSVHRGT